MSETTPVARGPLSLEDVARAASELQAEPDLGKQVARLLEVLESWAAPAAVLAGVEDPAAEAGWRLLPALGTGSGPLAAARFVARTVTGHPDGRLRPLAFPSSEAAASGGPLQDWLVPWRHEGEAGVLVLCGVAQAPSNLGQAVALVAAPVWPRLLGGPAERVEKLLEGLQGAADRLREETSRQVERLRAARPAETEAARLGELRAEAEALGQRAAAAEADREQARAEVARLTERLEALAAERATARQLEEARAAAEQEKTAASEAAAAATAAAVAEVTTRAEAAEAEREAARAEVVRLTERVEALAAEQAATAKQMEEVRASAESARTTASEAAAAAVAAATAAAVTEATRRVEVAESDRDAARAEVTRLTERVEALAAEQAATSKQLEEARAAAAPAPAPDAEATAAAVAEATRRVEAAEAERDAARAEVTRLTERVEAAEAAAQKAQAALATANVVGERTRAALTAALSRAEEAEARGRGLTSRWEDAEARVRLALRRAPFVAAELGEALSWAASPSESPAGPPWLAIALLDREAQAGLAGELEAAGVAVRTATHPEELALLLRSPEAKDLSAVVLDVMTFRPDQVLAGLIRAWDKDRPGLGYYLSFASTDAAEVERAKRVPLSLLAGHVQRPVRAAALVEALKLLARKQGKAQ